MIETRDYQTRITARVEEELGKKEGPVLMVMATGLGKTVVAAKVIHDRAKERGQRSMFLAPRREIVHQTEGKLCDFLVDPGIIMAGEKYQPKKEVQVASVDTLRSWIKRGKVRLEPEDLLVVDECFPGYVEILTEDGFVRFDEIDSQRVAQYDSGRISFVDPIRKVESDYCGELIRLKSGRTIDLPMTKNHDVVLFDKNGGDKKVTAFNMKPQSSQDIRVAAPARSGSAELNAFERLAIAVQADGYVSPLGQVQITLSKQRKIDRLLSILPGSGVRWTEVKGRPAHENVKARRRFLIHGSSLTKNIWDYFCLSSMSQQTAKAVIEEAVEWDGHRYKSGTLYYSSRHKKSADFYQAAAILAGYQASISVQVDRRSESYSDIYRLYINPRRDRINTQSIKKLPEPFDGKVYCVEVPSGKIVVRNAGRTAIIGNCHRSAGKTYRDLIEVYKDAGADVLGMTATPIRSDGVGLGQIYSTMVNDIPVTKAIEQGWLVKPSYRIPFVPDLSGVKVRSGEFSEEQVEEIMNQKHLVGDAAEALLKHGNGLKTLVFASGVKHSMHIAERYNEVGISCVHVDGGTPKDVRANAIRDFEAGRIQVLTNCNVFSEGTDIPSIECIQDLQPTKSIGREIQKKGRGMRPSPGKTELLILDHAGNFYRHGRIDRDIPWELCDGKEIVDRDRKAREREKVIFTCSECKTPFSGQPYCPQCGTKIQRHGKMHDFLDGELVSLTAEQFENIENIITESEKKRFYLECLGWARIPMMRDGVPSQRKHDGWAAYTYKDRYGEFPPWAWKSMLTMEPSAKTIAYITSRNIKRHFSRKRA